MINDVVITAIAEKKLEIGKSTAIVVSGGMAMDKTAQPDSNVRFRWVMPTAATRPDAEEIAGVFNDLGGDAEVESGRRFIGVAEATLFVLAFIGLPNLLRAFRDLFDKHKVNGVQIDLRTQPATITPVPELGSGILLVIHPDGTTTRYQSGTDSATLIEALQVMMAK